METEIWPNLLARLRSRWHSVVLANARMSGEIGARLPALERAEPAGDRQPRGGVRAKRCRRRAPARARRARASK
jgi:hypothetical protein